MAVDIGPKIGIDGEAQFKKQITSINSSLKVLGSEMKMVTAEFGKNAQSEEALTKQNEILTKKTDELKKMLKLQTEQLEKHQQETDADEEETKKLQIAVNKTTAELLAAEKQIRDNNTAMENMADSTEDAGDEFKDAGNEARVFGDVLKANVLGDVIMKGLDALANGIKKVAKGLKDAVLDGASFADEMLTMSKQTGLSTDTLQEFQYMAGLVDTDLSTITGALTKLTRNMSSASKGTGSAAEAFQKLGVQITNSDGSLRDNEEVFNDVIDALGKMTNETERDATAMEIFGKSAQELNPLILAGSDAIEGFKQEAQDMGYVLDNDALNSLGGVQDSLDRFSNLTTTIKNNLAEALAPTIEDLTTKFTTWAQSVDWDTVGEKITNFINFISQNGETIISIIAGITAATVAWKAVTLAADIAQKAFNVTLSANPIGLIITAVAGLVTALVTLWNTNEDFRNWVKGAWEDIKNFFVNAWEGIKKAFSEVGNFFSEQFTKARDGIHEAFDSVVGFFEDLWSDIKGVFSTVWDTFTGIGKNIVEGIWNGINGAYQWIKDKITGWVGNVLSFFKKLLGIESPSKVFRDQIGLNMALGVAEGWDEGLKDVERDMQNSMNSLLPTSTANIGVVSDMRGTGVLNGVRGAMADAVNAMGTLAYAGGGASGNLTIIAQVNGREFYRGSLADFRLVQRENPIILNDF